MLHACACAQGKQGIQQRTRSHLVVAVLRCTVLVDGVVAHRGGVGRIRRLPGACVSSCVPVGLLLVVLMVAMAPVSAVMPSNDKASCHQSYSKSNKAHGVLVVQELGATGRVEGSSVRKVLAVYLAASSAVNGLLLCKHAWETGGSL